MKSALRDLRAVADLLAIVAASPAEARRARPHR
jgi:hypothetical protein